MNYAYNNNFSNPYNRSFGLPNYSQPQYQPMPIQPQQMAQMQTQPQMQQQPMQPTMPIDMPIQSVVFATLKEAEAYILMPNTKGLFIDKTNGMIYEKICGADGQSFINHYQKVDQNLHTNNVQEQSEKKTPEFATKEDLCKFSTVEQYKELTEALKCLQAQIKGFTATQKQSTSESKPKAEPKTEKSK